MAKLTDPQRHLLENASRRPARVVVGYPPVNELAQIGFVEISTMEGSRIWTVTITAAGREALKQAKES